MKPVPGFAQISGTRCKRNDPSSNPARAVAANGRPRDAKIATAIASKPAPSATAPTDGIGHHAGGAGTIRTKLALMTCIKPEPATAAPKA